MEKLETIERIKLALSDLGFKCDRIVDSEDGDTSFYFFGKDHSRFASLTCDEDGGVVLLVADRKLDISEAHGVRADLHSGIRLAICKAKGFAEEL
jgi:hypothetical protein